MPLSLNNPYNGIVPSKISIRYYYPDDKDKWPREYESYSASDILSAIEWIEFDGGKIIEFSFDTRPLEHNYAYIGWGCFAQLIKQVYDRHIIDSYTYNAITSFIPERYRHIMSNEIST